MKKQFKIKNIVPFDLIRIDNAEFYRLLDQEYFKQFGKEIEILEHKAKFITGGLSIKILAFSK